MIRSFRHKGLARFANKGDRRGLGNRNIERIGRILWLLNAAKRPEDLDLPGMRLHGLKGSRAGTFAVNVSGNFRITFHWDGVDAYDVDLEDYH